jgi:hypothetical protein
MSRPDPIPAKVAALAARLAEAGPGVRSAVEALLDDPDTEAAAVEIVELVRFITAAASDGRVDIPEAAGIIARAVRAVRAVQAARAR